MSDDHAVRDRRRFLRTLAAVVAGAAVAPSVKAVAAQAIAGDPPPSPRPRTRWIGHF